MVSLEKSCLMIEKLLPGVGHPGRYFHPNFSKVTADRQKKNEKKRYLVEKRKETLQTVLRKISSDYSPFLGNMLQKLLPIS